MNELKVFENEKFGQIRGIEIEGESWLVGKDVAERLGYSNTKDALATHVDEEDRRIFQRSEIATFENNIPDIPNRGLTIINESGLFQVQERRITTLHGDKIVKTPLVTGKGQIVLIEKLKASESSHKEGAACGHSQARRRRCAN